MAWHIYGACLMPRTWFLCVLCYHISAALVLYRKGKTTCSCKEVFSSSSILGLLMCFIHCLQPCMVFVGEKFESEPQFQQSKSLLMDFFRGQEVRDQAVGCMRS